MYIKEEYYSILNASRTDSLDEIKKKYKRLALKHHPDVGGSEEYFKKINLAMDIINEFHKEDYTKDNNKSTNGQNNSKNSHNTNKTKDKSNNSSKSYKAKTKTKHYNSTKKKATSNKSQNKNVKCPNCGFSNDMGDNYCIMCGEQLRKKKEKTGSDDNSWIPGIFCVGVIIVSVGIILFTICWPMALVYFYIFYKFIFD